MKLPAMYDGLEWWERKQVREKYVELQKGNCYWCQSPLSEEPPNTITSKKINWSLFPDEFLKNPIHLQHDHVSGLTEGAVHAYCNAVMWQYHRR